MTTTHYAALSRLAVATGVARRFRLLEARAEKIATVTLDQRASRQVRVRVRKLLPPMHGIVEFLAVEIARPAGQGC